QPSIDAFYFYRDVFFHESPGNQCRPDAQEFFRGLDALHASHIRRPGQAQPREQAPEVVGDFAVLRAYGHAQEAFVQLVAAGRVRIRAEQRVVADVLDVRLLYGPTALIHQRLDDLRALFAFRIGLGPRKSDHP